jgi:hypothetical protein
VTTGLGVVQCICFVRNAERKVTDILSRKEMKNPRRGVVLRFFGSSHLDVRADRTQNWITQRIWTMSEIQIQIYIQCRWPVGKLLVKENPKFWCKYMEIFDDGVTVNGAGLWDAIENPVKILRWDDPDVHRGEDEEWSVLDGQVTEAQKGYVTVGTSRWQKMSKEKICGGSF